MVMERNAPLVSVIMGIYNCGNTLKEAVNSIFHQTYQNWELIMCDDGSKDNTFEVAQTLKNKYPEKIILLQNKDNKGLNYTLNRCLEVARGELIARMDGDDVCFPDRFSIEVRELLQNPNISIVSTDMDYFDANRTWGGISHPVYPSEKDFVYENPFCHAACMVRKQAYEAVNGYTVDRKLLRVEDYHLWIKMYAAGFKGKNIHKSLYQMRDDRNAYSRRKFVYRLNEAYVKRFAIRQLHLPKWMILYTFRPIVTWLIPKFLYDILRKKRLSKVSEKKT